ncbi:MAG: IclR family transcriptional regulator [Pararhodobacter sp.]
MGSLEKATELLRLIAAAREGARLGDLARESGMPTSTTHRLLSGLEALSLAMRRRTDRRYQLGGAFLTLCGAARGQFRIDELARPVLGLLSRRCGVTAYLSVISGLDAVCVLRVEGGNALRAVTLQEGARRPLGIGAGSMALLAALGDAEIKRIIAANALPTAEGGAEAQYHYDPDQVRAGIERTRMQGYASHSGQLVRGVDGIGVSAVMAGLDMGISLSFIGDMTTAEQRAAYLGYLREAARALEEGRG